MRRGGRGGEPPGVPRTARHPQSTPARPPWEAPGRRLLSQRPARGWLLGPLLLLPATAPILLGCPASLVTPNMLETAKPLMPFPRPVGSPWWWSLQGMCDHKFRKEVCVCVQERGVCVSRKEVCMYVCVCPQERGVYVHVCVQERGVCVCVCVQERGVCVSPEKRCVCVCVYPQGRGVCVSPEKRCVCVSVCVPREEVCACRGLWGCSSQGPSRA